MLVPIRETFEQFSSDPETIENLKRLYKTPDDVDLVVGCQLDETLFPHATIPTSSLIISLFSLISMGNSDRFSIGFAAMRCLLVDTPWNCHPTNALEDLIWKPMPKPGFPDFRFYDPYWMTELDFQAHGQNLMWRLVTENTDIKCLQQNPLFPMDPDTNPMLCTLPKTGADVAVIASTAVEVTLSLIRIHRDKIIFTGIVLGGTILLVWWLQRQRQAQGYPESLYGWPIIGHALDFQKDPKALLLRGFQQLARDPSRVFGMHLASLTHYVLSKPEDIQMMLDDNPYEMKFNLDQLFRAINVTVVLPKVDIASSIVRELTHT